MYHGGRRPVVPLLATSATFGFVLLGAANDRAVTMNDQRT
jgi:hypothetical protein